MSRATTAGLSRSGKAKTSRTLLAVICGRKNSKNYPSDHGGEHDRKAEKHTNGRIPSESRSNQFQHEFADLETSGYLEVHILEDPTKEELGRKLEKLHPDFLLLHGESSPVKDEIGGLVIRDGKPLSADTLASLYGAKVPNLIYLETSGAKLGEALRSQGVPNVIYWKGAPTSTLASHFRQALLAALRSYATEAKDAFQIANASFMIHCGQNKTTSVNGHEKASNVLPMLLAPPESEGSSDEEDAGEEGNDAVPADSAPVQVYDDDINIRLLVCSEASRPTSTWFGALEAGLSALLTIEAKGVRLLHRVSAPPPPMAASSLLRGVVTMRCDICTTTFARIALLVSGAAQTCFDDQLLENSVRKELLERCGKIRLVEDNESQKARLNCDLRRSVSIASGSSVVELKIKGPTWVGQVLRQLAADPSYRSLVALGIAGVEGAPVNAFLKEDSAHLVSLKRSRDSPSKREISNSSFVPPWLAPPSASRKRMRLFSSNSTENLMEQDRKASRANGHAASSSKQGNITLLAAMKPVPHSNRRRFMPFANAVMAAQHAGWTMKLDQTTRVERRRQRRADSGRPRTSTTTPGAVGGSGVNPYLSITPANVKPHGCNRPSMEECSEDEFLQDLVSFLESRGHSRLVPPAGLDAFPEVVLNGKRLDLYNLYKEVVSRGGFHVGNGINWKGQVFAKMHNHTSVNKMTGVGNTLKKHYETYLLEYELAHDDVDGECCILCHSGSEGDWVNCGICGEWAHFGCDQRLGLGAFKDYAKTDGLEYICPRCSEGKSNSRRSKKCLEVKSSQEIPSPPSDHAPVKQRRS